MMMKVILDNALLFHIILHDIYIVDYEYVFLWFLGDFQFNYPWQAVFPPTPQ
jgi:hypothetical protein